MPIAFWIWAGSLLASILAFSYASRLNKWEAPRKDWIGQLNVAGGLAVVVFALATLVGLWDAWSPWELTSR